MQRQYLTILILINLLLPFGAFPGNNTETSFENGYVSFIRGDYGTALEEFGRFIDFESKNPGPRPVKIALVRGYRGACFEKLRLTGPAIREQQAALSIYNEMNDTAEVATTLLKLGRLYMQEKKPEQALMFVRQATASFETMRWAAMLQNAFYLLGEIEYARKRYEAAQLHFLRSLSVNDRKGFRSEYTYLEGEAWFYLARIAAELDGPTQADSLLRKAESEFRMYVGDLPRFYSQWIDLLLYRAHLKFSNDQAIAWLCLSEASRIAAARSLVGKQQEIRLLQAGFLIRNKEFRKAEILLDRIKNNMDRPGNYSAFMHYPALLETSARLYLEWYQAEGGLSCLKKGLRIAGEFHRHNSPASNTYAMLSDRGYAGEDAKPLWDMTVWFAARLFELTGVRSYFEEAVDYAERFSAALFADESRVARDAFELSTDGKIRINEAMLRLKINNLIAETGRDGMTGEKEKALVKLVNQLENSRSSQNLSYSTGPDNAGGELVEKLQRKLAAQESYLKIYETEDKLLQFLITKDTVYFREIPKDSCFTSARDYYTAFLGNPGVRSNLPGISGFVKASRLLCQQLIDPWNNLPSGGDLVVDWPHSGNRLVFEPMLTSPVQDISLDMRRLPYLLWQRNIRYSGSIKLYLNALKKEPLVDRLPYAGFAPFAGEGFSRRSRLASSGREVKRLSGFFQGKYYMAGKATKKQVIRLADKSIILHLATHASENPDHPQLTGLNLAGKEKSTDHLYYYEINQTDWSQELVILGACGTASGAYLPGYGTASLANMFQAGGVPCVIGANWQANDDASYAVISRFAAHLKNGKTAGQSLWQSKKEFLLQTSDLHSHPYYWAVYTCQGQDQSVDLPAQTRKGRNLMLWMAGAGLLLLLGMRVLNIRKLKD